MTAAPRIVRCRLEVTSDLPGDLGHIPFSPVIDFGALVAEAGAEGVFDPNSIEVVDLQTGQPVEYGRSEDFAYGDQGRIEWPLKDPSHTAYELLFSTAPTRPPLKPQAYVPLVGGGDLLRYNAGQPRPVVVPYGARLVDLTGDGRAHLVGCWNYYRRPGDPVSGLALYPRAEGDLLFGDMARLRYIDGDEPKHFAGVYAAVDFADVDGDGRVDLAYAEQRAGAVTFFRQSGRCDGGGLPLFEPGVEVPVPFAQIHSICLVDVDDDGAVDLVVNGHLLRNANAAGWPFDAEAPVDLGSGERVCFFDLDGDGRPDLVGLEGPRLGARPVWRKNLGGLSFGPAQPLEGLEGIDSISEIGVGEDGDKRGLLVQSEAYQSLYFIEWAGFDRDRPRFAVPRRLESVSAVACWSDQAWPCVADWDGDGIWDLVIGGGYGWPRVARNRGTNARHGLDVPRRIRSEGQPIRLLRSEILPEPHWHDMGYPYPAFVDWDGDGLPDLMLPNETNRIVWYRNVGTLKEPVFGPRQFLEVDGYPDSDEKRAASARDGADETLPNTPYPRDERSPFFWRTGAAFADWNGDGLMDFITHDQNRQAALFVQYVDGDGKRRLKRQGPVLLEDGRVLDDAAVGRTKHWTESFRPVDWDGDGLTDLVWNLAGTGHIYLLRNVGTREEPVFAQPRQFKCYGEPLAFTIHGPNAWAADLNGDGKPDLLGCVEWSVYPFFAHAALEMEAHPKYRLGAARLDSG